LPTEIHNHARRELAVSPSAWMRQPVSSPWRTAIPFWWARIASASGANSGRKRRTLLAIVPGAIGSPWSAIHAATRRSGRKQAKRS